MWLCTNRGFLSIVADPAGTKLLLVRARRKGDIESLFPDADVRRTPGRDYLYRASVGRDVVSVAVMQAFSKIDYGNFKNSVKNRDLHHAYAEVWQLMSELQAVKPYGRDSAAARTREGEDKIKSRSPKGRSSI